MIGDDTFMGKSIVAAICAVIAAYVVMGIIGS